MAEKAVMNKNKEARAMSKKVKSKSVATKSWAILDEVRTDTYKQLSHPMQIISLKGVASNNFVCGHYTISKEIVDLCPDIIKKLTGQCNGLQGFLVLKFVDEGT